MSFSVEEIAASVMAISGGPPLQVMSIGIAVLLVRCVCFSDSFAQ